MKSSSALQRIEPFYVMEIAKAAQAAGGQWHRQQFGP
jgi:hypothetical protein